MRDEMKTMTPLSSIIAIAVTARSKKLLAVLRKARASKETSDLRYSSSSCLMTIYLLLRERERRGSRGEDAVRAVRRCRVRALRCKVCAAAPGGKKVCVQAGKSVMVCGSGKNAVQGQKCVQVKGQCVQRCAKRWWAKVGQVCVGACGGQKGNGENIL